MIRKQTLVKTTFILIFLFISSLMLSFSSKSDQHENGDFSVRIINSNKQPYLFFDKTKQSKNEFLNPEILYVYFKNKDDNLVFIQKVKSETDFKKLNFVQVLAENSKVNMQTIFYPNSVELIFVSKNTVRKLLLFCRTISEFPDSKTTENHLIYFAYFDLTQLKYLIRNQFAISTDFEIEIQINNASNFKKNLYKKLDITFNLINIFQEKKEYKTIVIPVQDRENIYKIENNYIDFEYFKIALNADLMVNKLQFNFILDKDNLPVKTEVISEQKIKLNYAKEVYLEHLNSDISFLYIKINQSTEMLFFKENEDISGIKKVISCLLKIANINLATEFEKETTLKHDNKILIIKKTTLINKATKVNVDYKAELEKQVSKLSEMQFDSDLSLTDLAKSVLKNLTNKAIQVKIIAKKLSENRFICEFFDSNKPEIKVQKTLFFKKLNTVDENKTESKNENQEINQQTKTTFLKYKIPIISALIGFFLVIALSVIIVIIWRIKRNVKQN